MSERKELIKCRASQAAISSVPGAVQRQCVKCSGHFWKHPEGNPNTHLCCTCRVEAKIALAKRREAKATATRPGYPKQEQFQDEESIARYLANEKLECLLCGRSFVNLSNHISRFHNIPVERYHDQFGIPRSRGLIGEHLKASQHHRMVAWNAALAPEVVTANTSKALEAAHAAKRTAPLLPVDVARLSKLQEMSANSPNRVERKFKGQRQLFPCADCGEPAMTSTVHAIKNACKVFCAACGRARALASGAKTRLRPERKTKQDAWRRQWAIDNEQFADCPVCKSRFKLSYDHHLKLRKSLPIYCSLKCVSVRAHEVQAKDPNPRSSESGRFVPRRGRNDGRP